MVQATFTRLDGRKEVKDLPRNLPLDLLHWLDNYCSKIEVEEDEDYWSYYVSAVFEGSHSKIGSSCCISFASLEQSLRALQANMLREETDSILEGNRND